MNSVHTDLYVKLIAGLIEARQNAKLTQQDVADKLGKPQSYVAKIEGCERRLDIAEFVDYAGALGEEPEKLFGVILRGSEER